jgi:hypothetical protein
MSCYSHDIGLNLEEITQYFLQINVEIDLNLLENEIG